MSHLTDLADALPIVRTVCILTAATCRILFARLNTPASTRHNTTRLAENSTTPEAPTSTAPQRQHTWLSRALHATLHATRGAAAFTTMLSWLHQTGAP
jgi:hypothetical protein